MIEGLAALAADPAAWVALATLVVMEVVLGIDNLIFISVLSNKLPATQRARARRIGLALALGLRLALLASVAWIVQLTEPLFAAFGRGFSWRDMILIGGGLFLVWKATKEIHHTIERRADDQPSVARAAGIGFAAAIGQIILLDLVFSIDSIITAVGMTDHVAIMIAAVIIAVGVMMFAATPLADFIARHPSVVMLALSFLMLVGTALIADGFGVHVPKGYIYAAMGFSALVEGLNIVARRRRGLPAPA